MKKWVSFIVALCLLIGLALYSMSTGSIQIGFGELVHGLIVGDNPQVDVIRDLRLPRIFVAMLSGAALAVSGVLLQSVMRNPLADAGVIGISAGAGFASLIVTAVFPALFFFNPLFSVIGGLFACFLVYLFSWKSGLQPLRLLLVGVAINAMFTGFNQVFSSFGSSSSSAGRTAISTFNMQTWQNVDILLIYVGIALILSVFLATWCNMLALQDRTASNLGLNVMRSRIVISLIAVILASVATAVGGLIVFVGLLVPHIARQFVGSDHRILIPFSAVGGAVLILFADTLGRTIIAPIEIPASVIMMIIGGPFLIFMLLKGDRVYGR
ncbi:iron ABC transporter permease [Cohnella sp. WQ 127256]|uniref:FecCD family ABC transporter permease n=1 Tax=Cohnella sp. WQ 127256 TaxID=2938790 RepID=UPI002117FA26|nr:iron ABC transporter permease [Cohnella sp. WQ 127256]